MRNRHIPSRPPTRVSAPPQALKPKATVPLAPPPGSELESSFLSVGDIAPNWPLVGPNGSDFSFRTDSVAGNTIVFLFVPNSPESAEHLACFEQHAESLVDLGARIFAVFSDANDPRFQQRHPCKALADSTKAVAAGLGSMAAGPTTIVLRPNSHVAGIFVGDPQCQASKARSACERLCAAGSTMLMQPHPPVLFVPEVLSPEDCQRLITIFETRGQAYLQETAAIDYIGADYKMRVPEQMREDRIDHYFFEKQTTLFLLKRLLRVEPEILRAFQYRVTKYESLRMACYQGSRGGYGHGHRDNIAPYVHRRFAMSINLNADEYEGGELRFPEFGDRRYKPETGTGFIFSSSLLHEAMQVTSGKRYVFLSFMYGDI